MGGVGESHGALDGYRVPPAAAKVQLQLQRERLGAVAGVAIRRDAEGADGGAGNAPTVEASGVDARMDLRTHMPVWLEAFRPVRNNET